MMDDHPHALLPLPPVPVRCPWCGVDPAYVQYHDEEWGKPVYDDEILFEFLILESAQAGLSWLTILRKREHYRKAFANFDVQKVASFSEIEIQHLMLHSGIVRYRLKIEAAIRNAQAFITIQEKFGSFSDYLWELLPNKQPMINHWTRPDQVPTRTNWSDQMSLKLKKQGFSFLGTTTCYAYMQAMGMVNDHLVSCLAR